MKATPLGLFVALIGVVVGGIFKGVSPIVLITNVPALFIVILGAFGATVASFEMRATSGVMKAIARALFPKNMQPPADRLKTLVDFAGRARHEGILSLESEVADLDDPFMKKALQLAIDGNDPESVADVMRTDIRTLKARHKVAADWCMAYGIFAPTFGIIGAVMGLIATLSHLDEPEKLGYGISAAFVATFWGVFLANGIMLPLANKLKNLSSEEVQGREMVMEGVLAIQGGQNPRVIEETLMTYLPPAEALAIGAAKDG
ncbi:MAG: motility protein A [Ilumatobacter sp.]|uniref:motility protein A n=1 Tax=Ilumatobacter sp. TaxID=1967498 RepID=UPI0026355B79|nr:motility protein A [Ilumatobacter sp.]MDJ0767426.1 motility protein A [Ilumatobacter sp.]